MKKLMFILAAAATAASVQAASVNWTCSDVMAGNEDDGINGVAYFLTTDMLAYSDAQALAGKGADAIKAALGTAYSFSGSDGKFTVKASNAVANSVLHLDDGSDYTAYLMIFDTATVTDDSKFYLTSTAPLSTLSGADDSAKISWGSQFDNTKSAGAWASAKTSGGGGTSGGDAPEPTSGLLLLVGGAMLALRRKQK